MSTNNIKYLTLHKRVMGVMSQIKFPKVNYIHNL